MFTQETMDETAKYPGLGPAYFAARAVVEQKLQGLEPEHFKPMVDKIVDQIRGAFGKTCSRT